METINTLIHTKIGIIFIILIIISNTFTAFAMNDRSELKLWMRLLLIIPPLATITSLVILKIGALIYLKENFVKYFKK